MTPYVAEVGDQLQDIGIPLRNGTEVEPNELNFLGKGDVYIVLVPPGAVGIIQKKLPKHTHLNSLGMIQILR